MIWGKTFIPPSPLQGWWKEDLLGTTAQSTLGGTRRTITWESNPLRRTQSCYVAYFRSLGQQGWWGLYIVQAPGLLFCLLFKLFKLGLAYNAGGAFTVVEVRESCSRDTVDIQRFFGCNWPRSLARSTARTPHFGEASFGKDLSAYLGSLRSSLSTSLSSCLWLLLSETGSTWLTLKESHTQAQAQD